MQIAAKILPQIYEQINLDENLKSYQKYFNEFVSLEIIEIAKDFNDLNYFLDAPEVEFSPSDDFDFAQQKHFLQRNLPAYYLLNAVLAQNSATQNLAQSQLTTADAFAKIYAHFEGYISPAQIAEKSTKLSSRGGRARAEKLYGKTKQFAFARYKQIRAANPRLSLSQIANKIAYELEQSPIENDEPLTNPYDTIYRWVRGLGKVVSR